MISQLLPDILMYRIRIKWSSTLTQSSGLSIRPILLCSGLYVDMDLVEGDDSAGAGTGSGPKTVGVNVTPLGGY
jgi:hypothetical protein